MAQPLLFPGAVQAGPFASMLALVGCVACDPAAVQRAVPPDPAPEPAAVVTAVTPLPSPPWYASGDSACPEGAALAIRTRGELTTYACEADGRLAGPFSRVDGAGVLREEGWYQRGSLHRSITRWNARGQRVEQVTYSGGIVHGPRATWHDDGSLATRGSFGNGLPHGEYHAWYRNGEDREYGRFDSGRPHGRWTYWDESGRVTRVEVYDRGTLFERIGRAPEISPDALDLSSTLHSGVYVTKTNLSRILVGYDIRESTTVDGRISRRTYTAWYRGVPALEIAPDNSGRLERVSRSPVHAALEAAPRL